MLEIVLIDTDPEFATEIEFAVRESQIKIAAVGKSLGEAKALLDKHRPTVVCLGPNLDAKAVGDVLKQEADKAKKNGFVLFGPHQALAKTRPAGLLAEIISAPMLPKELVGLIDGVGKRLMRGDKPSGARGKVVTVFSTKGGVGKSMISSNLATHMARAAGKRIALIDLDLQFGDIGVMLGLKPEMTIYDCLPVSDELSGSTIEKFLTPHRSGVKAMLAPLRPELADAIPAKHIVNVVEALRSAADIIVADTPASFNDHVLSLLDETDLAVLVATMDIPSVKNIKLCLETLRSLQFSDDKIALVINRAEDDVGLKRQEIEEALGKTALLTIPTDRKVPLSINQGAPVVLAGRRSPAARSLIDLAENILDRLKIKKTQKVA
jgi:pilus assembly protein CpaE